MPQKSGDGATLVHLDDPTRALVQLSAALASGSEDDVRNALHRAKEPTPHDWIEELLLQTYLFAGFPRALNGMREWRRLSPTPAANTVSPNDAPVADGEDTCARVYGAMYERLRHNIAALHPRLDEWMIAEGYGKVLSRPGLDLGRRELCIVAACAATGQDRQLQSHLHGAQNAGVPDAVIGAAVASLRGLIAADLLDRAERLWAKVAA
ncbi:MAG TPA: carboxymuconolactone decarboxylase family protein [Gemmatimonadaceae bacterium]